MGRRVVILAVLLASLNVVLSYTGPVAYLTEEVSADYNYNGSPIGGSSLGIGYVDVGVPNTVDVLQYIRVTLAGNTSATDLLNNVTYHSVAASPNYAYEKTRLLHNTTITDMDRYYNITSGASLPLLNATIVVTNLAGGPDVYSNDNIWDHGFGYTPDVNLMNFKIYIQNPSLTRRLDYVNVTVTFQKDSGSAGEDAVNITSAVIASTGSAVKSDSDTDTYIETIKWGGNFTQGMILVLEFNGTITEGYNLPNATTTLNLNGLKSNTRGARTEYSNNTATFTQITISGKFSRGPVLNGVEIASAGPNWKVRAFFENIANNSTSNPLIYNVTEWRLYEVNATTGAPNATATDYDIVSGTWNEITAGTRLYTKKWMDHQSATKPYYTPYFDWSVIWNETSVHYESKVNTTLIFQTLHLNDIVNEKSITGVLIPNSENDSITIQDKVTFIGSNSIDIDRLQINSTIPHLLDNASPGGLFRINTSTFYLTFTNSSGTFPVNLLSSTISLTYADPSESADGYVRLNISDVATTQLVQGNLIGVNMQVNDYFVLSYDLLSNSTFQDGFNFTFEGNTTAWTHTPNKEKHPPATITVTPKRLTAYKSLIALDPNNPTLINVTIFINVIDKGPSQTGISGIKFVDYVPNGTNFNVSTPIYVSFYNESSNAWETWTKTVEYNQTDLGIVLLSDGNPANAWEYTNSTNSTGWVMHDNETLIFKYQINITDPRVYTLPVELAGFDPDTGRDLSTSAFGVIRVIVPEGLLPPVITEGALTLSKFVTVGKNADWIKNFEVYNPNMRVLSAQFEATVFPDTVKAYVVYTDDSGVERSEEVNYIKRGDDYLVTWSANLLPFETRNYYIKVMTPAVVSVDRDITVLEKLTEDTVKLRLDVDMKNLAIEDYPLVRLYLPLRSEQILSAVDSLGNTLEFSGSTAVIQLSDFKGLESRSASIEFKESYPIVIVTPDKEQYDINNDVNLDIRVINGGVAVDHPYLETEVYSPYEDMVYSNIREIGQLGIIETGNYAESFQVPTGAPTGMYVASVRFREDFNVISTGDASFKIIGESGYTILGALLLVGAIIGVSYVSVRKYKEVKRL